MTENRDKNQGNIILQTEQLVKRFGSQLAVNNLTLRVRRGEIFSLLGPNGAGKTTTFKLIMGIIKPTSGLITIFNNDNLEQNKEKISYFGEDYRLYNYLTAEEIIELAASFYQKPDLDWGLTLLKDYNIPLNKEIKYLSRGMRQLVKLTQALLNQGHLIILDEPTLGLDVEMQNEIHRLLKKLRNEGKTIIFSTHNLSEVEKLADRVAFLKSGQLVGEKEVEDLPNQERRIVFVPQRDIEEDIMVESGVTGIEKTGDKYYIYYDHNEQGILSSLNQVPYYTLKIEKPDLEELFLQLTGGERNVN